MMNTKPIEQAKNPLLAKALPALMRAAEQAKKLAMQTGTDLVVQENGEIRHITFINNSGVAESRSNYNPGTDNN